MADHSLLTPKERARLVINSAFASNFEKLINSHRKSRASSSSATKRDNLMECSVESSLQNDPSGNAPEADDNSHWHNSSDFYVSMLNYSLGLGTLLGFPRLCYKHGGGVFLIPYLIMLFVEGIPLVCLEIAIGQRFQNKYLLATWKRIHPSTIGLGLSTVFASFAVILYFNIIVAWSLLYFVQSLQRTLPWTSCLAEQYECTNCSTPSEYYWYKTTLGASSDINSIQDVNWNIFLYVVISWFLVLLYNIKGVKAAAKPGYVVLILTMVLYVTLFLLVVHLDGWARGLAILVDFRSSQISKLLSFEIWRDAASQVFFSLGIGFGSIIVYASYNNVAFECKTAALWYGLIDTVVGIGSCIIVFSVRGFQAYTEKHNCMNKLLQSNVSSIVQADSSKCNKSFLSEPIPDAFSFAFISWSDSFTHIIYPPLWSSLSYLLLFLVGFGTMSGMVLVVTLFLQEITALRQEFAAGLVCLVSCLLGLLFVTDGGLYLVNLFHNYSACALHWIVLIEVLSVACLFGRKKFCTMVEDMTGKPLHCVLKLSWFVFSPAILLTMIASSFYDMALIKGGYSYSTWQPLKGIQNVLYPSWCYIVIAAFYLLPLLFIFGVFFIYSIKSRHLFFQVCRDSWKRLWYWCRREEEYELQEFSEVQRRYERGVQISVDRIDANFPELLSFDNVRSRENINASSTCVKNSIEHTNTTHHPRECET